MLCQQAKRYPVDKKFWSKMWYILLVKDENYYLVGLNERQKEAVLSLDGPLLMLAGAGAGKTKTITHRILHLIKTGVSPQSILAITFTNKAASEMKERLGKLLSEDEGFNFPVSGREEPFVSTFHSLGVYILKDNAELLNMPRHFSIYDKNDSKQAIKIAMERVGVDSKQFEPQKILSIISKQKGNGVDFDEFSTFKSGSYVETLTGQIWEEYEKILKKEKAFDFDDLLLKTLLLLRKPEILSKYQEKWKYIHIDEYQDTNRVQYEIVRQLANKHKNVAVVGDVDQSIYSWRGADFKNLLRFEKDYPECKTILLEENYRSTKTIIEVSNRIIEKNTMRKDKTLFTRKEQGDLISLYGAFDERDEAFNIAQTIEMLIRQGVPASEIAILYRANFQSRAIEEALIKKNISYNLLGTKFFERKEIKDVLSYLRSALNPENTNEFKRACSFPPRGIGKTTLLKMFEGKENELTKVARDKVENFRDLLREIKEKAETLNPSEVIKHIISRSGIEMLLQSSNTEDLERLENVRELVTIASEYDKFEIGEGIEKFMMHIDLQSDQDELKDENEAVRLMTVHASKGLEFDIVFITGLEEGLFPHKGIGHENKNIEEKEEERRLFYVALTRARKKVYLSYAQMRTIFGSKQMNIQSEFILDIEDRYIEEISRKSNSNIVYLDIDF